MITKRTILDTLDPEIAARLVTRRGVFRGAGRLGAGLAGASVPVLLAGMAKRAFAQGGLPENITAVLNFALTLEYLEDEFYRLGLTASGAIEAQNRRVFQQISDHEAAHVALLASVLGDAAVEKPEFDFTAGGMFADVFSNPGTFLALSQGFEDTGVRAYKGQAPNLISSNAILTTALQIHSVEARHASEVRRIRGQKGWITGNQTDVPVLQPAYAGEENVTQGGVNVTAVTGAPDGAVAEAFDEPLDMADVLAIANLFIT